MASSNVPHFHNDFGVASIEIGVKKFLCMGATPPFDHPHTYLEMGAGNDKICPYCSTRFVYNSQLGPRDSIPAQCFFDATSKVA